MPSEVAFLLGERAGDELESRTAVVLERVPGKRQDRSLEYQRRLGLGWL